MKRLVIALMLILFLTAPALALDRNLFYFASAPGGGGAGLKKTTDWTLATGLVYGDNQTIGMNSIINADSFDDSSLATFWNTSTNGSGTVVETSSLVITSPAAADAAILCYTQPLNPRATTNYRIRATSQVTLVATYELHQSYLEYNASVPVVASSASTYANQIALNWNSGNNYYVNTRTAGSIDYWLSSSSSGWTGSLSKLYPLATGTTFIHETENDGTTLWQRIYDSTGTILYHNTQRPIADLKAEANNTYWCIGDPYTNLYDGILTVTSFEHHGDYPTTSPVATMGQITVGATITHLGIFENNEAGCNITWRYDIGAGWVAPGSGTLSELETALVGTEPATLNLEAAYNSNGTDNCVLSLDGSAITN
jgi:hypothetical protein